MPQDDLHNALIKQELNRHDAALTDWLNNFLGNAETAANIKQCVFLRVLEYTHENKIEDTKTLLFRIARSLAINELQRGKQFNASHVKTGDNASSDTHNPPALTNPTPEEHAVCIDETSNLAQAIKGLPQRQRLTFILNRTHGLSYKEIALKLSVSESSVEKYMVKALKALRKKLET